MFKPNLIPNNKDNKIDIFQTIEDNGGVRKYIVTHKKDGCRVEFVDGKCLTRALKPIKSKPFNDIFLPLAKLFNELDLVIEGEFYAHGFKFNEIFRFFSNSDITRQEEIDKLTKLQNKGKLDKEFPSRSIEWLTTFHDDLKVWIFDGYIKGSENKGYKERLLEIIDILKPYFIGGNLSHYIELPDIIPLKDKESVLKAYGNALNDGWEGLVFTHKQHIYKNGRTTLKQGTLLKMKDDRNEYDGVVLDVEEGTKIKEGIEKTTNELGNSKTSQFKDDREPSGMAKGFVVEYNGNIFTVSLKGFDNEAKKELLNKKANYIGRHFKYEGMKPTKAFPRHAYFSCWRDDK